MFKKIKDFCKNHKDEIAFGAVIIGTVTFATILGIKARKSYIELKNINEKILSDTGWVQNVDGCTIVTKHIEMIQVDKFDDAINKIKEIIANNGLETITGIGFSGYKVNGD